MTVDSLLENNATEKMDYRCSFETFKSNTCHHVKDMGDNLADILKAAKAKKERNK